MKKPHSETVMENYIVRVYRRDEKDPQQIAGMVEDVEKSESTAFHSLEELMQLMNNLPKEAGRKFNVIWS